MARKRKKIFAKNPDSQLDYNIQWEEWLEGDTILSSSWDVPAGLNQLASNYTVEGLATVWLSDGIVGIEYEVVNTIVTLAGRMDQRSIFIKVVNLK